MHFSPKHGKLITALAAMEKSNNFVQTLEALATAHDASHVPLPQSASEIMTSFGTYFPQTMPPAELLHRAQIKASDMHWHLPPKVKPHLQAACEQADQIDAKNLSQIRAVLS